MTDYEKLEEALKGFRSPLEFNEIEFRVGRGQQIMPYINSRSAYDRLDKYFGLRWSSNISRQGEGFICSITISEGNESTTRTDGSDDSDVESYKGGISDAVKRACHQFGLGRELYRWPKIKVVDLSKEDKYVPYKLEDKLEAICDIIRKGGTTPQWIYFKKDGTRCDRNGNPLPPK